MGRPALDAKDWEAIWSLFDRCAPLGQAQRAAVLDAETTDRPDLRAEVEALLAHEATPDAYFGRPLLQGVSEAAPTGSFGAPIAPPASPTPFTPQRLGQYWVGERLGRGGMAEVFLGKASGPLGFSRLLAIKRILPAAADNPEFRGRFALEAKLSNQLNHANIVHVYELSEADGTLLLAMEFVDGINLEQVLERAHAAGNPIPLELAVFAIARTADGLHYAHQRRDDHTGQPLGIVHRDISPKNIMISFDGAVKIVDFGIAKAAGDARYTRTGTIRGTAGYLSPEMLSGDPIGPASDVFSACSVLFELTSGSPLFPQENIMAISRAIQDAAGIAARIESLAAPAEIRSLLARGLARDPRLRMSAAELRDGLDGYLAENGGPGAPDRIAYYLRGLFAETIARRREAIRRTVQLDGNDPAPTAMVRPSRFRFWRIALITATSAIALFFLLGLLRRPPFAPPFPPGYSGGRPPFPPPGRAGSTAPFPARKRR